MSRRRPSRVVGVLGLVLALAIATIAPTSVAGTRVAGAQVSDEPEIWVQSWEDHGLLPCYIINRDRFPGAIYRLYRAALDREPDAFGYTYWVIVHIAGDPPGPPPWPTTPVITIAEIFIGSGEFQARYGALDDASFVDVLYANVLGRDADAAGRAYWLGQLAAGTSRAAVLLGFSESLEFRAATAEDVPPDYPLEVGVDDCAPYSGLP